MYIYIYIWRYPIYTPFTLHLIMIHLALLLHSGDPGPGVCQGPNRLLYVWDLGTMRYRFIDNFPIKVGINMICVYIYKYILTICNYIYYILDSCITHTHVYLLPSLNIYIYIFICIHVAPNLHHFPH